MSRWYHSKDLKDSADMAREGHLGQLLYAELKKFLDRRGISWQTVDARLNFVEPEPQYNLILIDGIMEYADQLLIDNCTDILMQHYGYTFSDNAIAKVTIDFDTTEPPGSYGFDIDYLARID